MEETTRNFTYLFYGLLAAWTVLCVYVVSLAARDRKTKRELDRLKMMVEDKERETGAHGAGMR
jgi:CcmD family protein